MTKKHAVIVTPLRWVKMKTDPTIQLPAELGYSGTHHAVQLVFEGDCTRIILPKKTKGKMVTALFNVKLEKGLSRKLAELLYAESKK